MARHDPPESAFNPIQPSANGLKATCLNGCAWKELTFGCELPFKQPCKAEIDQVGVTGVR